MTGNEQDMNVVCLLFTFDVDSGQNVLERCRMQQITNLLLRLRHSTRQKQQHVFMLWAQTGHLRSPHDSPTFFFSPRALNGHYFSWLNTVMHRYFCPLGVTILMFYCYICDWMALKGRAWAGEWRGRRQLRVLALPCLLQTFSSCNCANLFLTTAAVLRGQIILAKLPGWDFALSHFFNFFFIVNEMFDHCSSYFFKHQQANVVSEGSGFGRTRLCSLSRQKRRALPTSRRFWKQTVLSSAYSTMSFSWWWKNSRIPGERGRGE